MSNETKFTAGPWIVCHTGPHWNNPDLANIDIQKSNGENITETVYEETDAYLIAAAPEMYEHINIIKEMIDDGDILFRHPMSKMTLELRIDQLLAKARGDNNA